MPFQKSIRAEMHGDDAISAVLDLVVVYNDHKTT